VSIRFVIGADGRVMTSMVESSTLGVPSVEQCVARAVQRISFPSTTGGVVLVTYPFMFQPAPEPRR
jgi:outer membrane biosynthesis protein TonB